MVGNSNPTENSGASRITMESRVRLAHNLITANEGGLSLERSEISAERNTVWQEWNFAEDKETLGPSRFAGNVLKGPAGKVEGKGTFAGNMTESRVVGTGNVAVADIFENDGVTGGIKELRYDAATMTTHIVLAQPLPAGAYTGRVAWIRDGGKQIQWRVLKETSDRTVMVWGRLRAASNVPKHIEILRTFRLRPDAPAGLGAVLNQPRKPSILP